jgi:hypothetical protein
MHLLIILFFINRYVEDYPILGQYDLYCFITLIFSNIMYISPTIKHVTEEKSINLCLPEMFV